MKRWPLLLLCCLPALPARADLTLNIHPVTDYVYRGISNSNRGPAIQGGLDYSHKSGLYLGTWASTVDFRDGGQAVVELDLYGGWSGRLAGLDWDAGYLRFIYPSARQSLGYDSNEAHLGLRREFGPVTAGATLYYSDDYSGAGESWYLSGDLALALPRGFSLDLHLGRQWFEKNAAYGLPDYHDWGLTLRRQLAGFDLALGWKGTGLSAAECFGGASWCRPAVTFEVTRYFGLLE